MEMVRVCIVVRRTQLEKYQYLEVGVGIGNFGINEMVVQRSAVIIPYIGANPRNTLNMVEWGRNVTEYKWNVCHVALR